MTNMTVKLLGRVNSDHSLVEYSARCSKSGESDCIFQVPKQIKFSAGLNQDQQWVILGECGVSAPVLQNNGSWYYQLYHPGTPDEHISLRNITVNSSVQQSQGKGVTCVKVDFFYHVKVITSGEDQSSCIIMRCNPVWNTTEAREAIQGLEWIQAYVLYI
jgi:hypothetical protein